jgi:hypothetical protein
MTPGALTTRDDPGTVGSVNIAATRVLTVLRHDTSGALCVQCLARVTAVPRAIMRATTTGLLEAGRVTLAPEPPCQVCGKQPALRATGVQ